MPLPQSSSFGRIKARPPHAAAGQVIGLLGGSFNPPHVAHRMISEVALKRLGLDKVWWIVSPGNPLKRRRSDPVAGAADIVPGDDQEPAHCRYRLRGRPPLALYRLDDGVSEDRSPLVRFVWIMGADNLASFDRWQRWREIFTTVPIVVVDRPGWRMKALASKAARAFADPSPGNGGRGLAHTAAAGVDIPYRPAVAGVVHRSAQQNQAPGGTVAKKHSYDAPELPGTEGQERREPPGTVAPGPERPFARGWQEGGGLSIFQ